MEYHECAFAAPLVASTFGCAQAEAATRRGGSDVACRATAGSRRCSELFERIKAALSAFGVEDDLESMPHSVLVKILHGGLLGWQRALGGTPVDVADAVDGVCGTRRDMTGYRLRRRR